MSEVIRHVATSIGPASQVHAEAVRGRFAAQNLELLARLAGLLGGAQHTAAPKLSRRTIVVVAGDHGAADPGITLEASHPTVIAAREIAAGHAALASMARTSRASLVVVDAGVAEAAAMPAAAIKLGRGPTRDLLREPAMTVVDATLGIEAGIAFSLSLSELGLDVLGLGALGLGSELAAAAIAGTAQPTRASSPDLPPDLGDAYHRGCGWSGSALELVATFGGPETCVLAGLMLGAASLHLPIILDGHATGAAAVVAMRFAPAITDYLIAAHRGSPLQAMLLAELGLAPVFEVGLGHGEGTGAALLLPWLDQVEALLAPR